MNKIFDNPVVGVAIVVIACIFLFAPTIIGHFRRIQSFRSVSALNALVLLLAGGLVVPGFIWGLSPLFLWITMGIWAAAAIWSLSGRRRDEP